MTAHVYGRDQWVFVWLSRLSLTPFPSRPGADIASKSLRTSSQAHSREHFCKGFTLHDKVWVLKTVARNCLLQCSEQCQILLLPGNHPHLSGWRRSGTNIEGSPGGIAGIPEMAARDQETALHLQIRSTDRPMMLNIPIGEV